MNNHRTIGVAMPLVAAAAFYLAGCYNFSAARREARENEATVRAINAEIEKEIDRKKELENSNK